ncbi:MAG: type II toxin-antitoxin system VapC family toxin, partial [Prochlorothrix sp.]
HQLVWSYILDYENGQNPYAERREQIESWLKYASEEVQSSAELRQIAQQSQTLGLKQMDALHLACALIAQCDYFLTTDKGILKKAKHFDSIRILDPIRFIQETTP